MKENARKATAKNPQPKSKPVKNRDAVHPKVYKRYKKAMGKDEAIETLAERISDVLFTERDSGRRPASRLVQMRRVQGQEVPMNGWSRRAVEYEVLVILHSIDRIDYRFWEVLP